MQPRFGISFLTRHEILTQNLGRKILGTHSYREHNMNFWAPTFRNEPYLYAADFTSMLLYGHVLADAFMGRLSDTEYTAIDLGPSVSQRQEFWEKEFSKLRILPFKEPFSLPPLDLGRYLMPTNPSSVTWEPITQAGGKAITGESAPQVADLMRDLSEWIKELAELTKISGSRSGSKVPPELTPLQFDISDKSISVIYSGMAVADPLFSYAKDIFHTSDQSPAVYYVDPDTLFLQTPADIIRIHRNANKSFTVNSLSVSPSRPGKKAASLPRRWPFVVAGLTAIALVAAAISAALLAPVHATELTSQLFTNSGSLGHAVHLQRMTNGVDHFQLAGVNFLSFLLLLAAPKAPGTADTSAAQTNDPRSVLKEKIGMAIQDFPAWSFAFIDLNKMFRYNDALGKEAVNLHYRDVLKELIENRIAQGDWPAETVWGFMGGDEIVILFPQEMGEARKNLEELHQQFESATPQEMHDQPIRQMTFSAGLINKQAAEAMDPQLATIAPIASFSSVSDLASGKIG